MYYSSTTLRIALILYIPSKQDLAPSRSTKAAYYSYANYYIIELEIAVANV